MHQVVQGRGERQGREREGERDGGGTERRNVHHSLCSRSPDQLAIVGRLRLARNRQALEGVRLELAGEASQVLHEREVCPLLLGARSAGECLEGWAGGGAGEHLIVL
jgi:hypothetical protein